MRIIRYILSFGVGLLFCLLFLLCLRFFFEGLAQITAFISPFVVGKMGWRMPLEQFSSFPIEQWPVKSFLLVLYLLGVAVIFSRHLKIGDLLGHPFTRQKDLLQSLAVYTFYWFFPISVVGAICFLWSFMR